VQHWHERYTHDPASKWLRGVIAELFLEKSGGERDPGVTSKSHGAVASAANLSE
jgi:hypothetical protein